MRLFRPAFLLTALTVTAIAGFVVAPAFSFGAWRSELYGENWKPPGLEKSFYTDKILQDYSYAGYRLGEAVPNLVAPSFGLALFNVVNAPYHADPTGTADSTAAIQQAIDDAGNAGRGVVFLPEGTYRVSASSSSTILRIEKPNVVLRGAGVGKTFLLNTTYNRRQQRIISVLGPAGGWRNDLNPAVSIVRDLMGPTRVIPVETTRDFSVGDWVVIRTDTTVEWVDEHHEPDWRNHAGSHSDLNGLAYYRQILAIDEEAGTLLIDIPTRYALKTRDAARVHPAPPLISEVGLEDFSIGNIEHPGTGDEQWSPDSYLNPDHHAYQLHGSAAISFSRARDCWVRNVHSFRPAQNSRDTHLLSNGVVIGASRSLTLENVHMQRPLYGGGGSNGYMFRVANASDLLFTRCLASHNRHGFVFSSMSSTGNVIHDSKDRFTNTQAAGTGRAGGANSDHHMFFSHSNLVDHSRVRESMFEARYRPFTSSPRHNITAAHSTFWNTMGLGEGDNVVWSDQARYGYVIGTQGLDGSSRYGAVLGDGRRPQTLPGDHLEGVGQGATLDPPSLYLDQLAKRRASIQLHLMQQDGAFLPSNLATLAAHPTIGPALNVRPEDLVYQWSLLEGPGAAEFSHPDQLRTRLLLEKPGTYRVRLTATAGPHQGELITTVRFSPYAEAPVPLENRPFAPTDDAHVQKSNPEASFGGGTTLQAKALGNTHERQAFLRFDLAGLDPAATSSATLHLEKTNASTPHSAALFWGNDGAWSETTLTYNNAPDAELPVASWEGNGQPGPLALDVTPAVIHALAKDSLLTLRLAVLEQEDPNPLMRYASREHADPVLRPRLEVVTRKLRQSYTEWLAAESIPPGEQSPSHDRFGRGISNLVSYLTGISSAQPAPPVVRTFIAAGSMHVEFPWHTSLPPNAWFLLQESRDLSDWLLARAVVWNVAALDPDRILVQGQLPLDLDLDDRRFFRLRFFLEE